MAGSVGEGERRAATGKRALSARGGGLGGRRDSARRRVRRRARAFGAGRRHPGTCRGHAERRRVPGACRSRAPGTSRRPRCRGCGTLLVRTAVALARSVARGAYRRANRGRHRVRAPLRPRARGVPARGDTTRNHHCGGRLRGPAVRCGHPVGALATGPRRRRGAGAADPGRTGLPVARAHARLGTALPVAGVREVDDRLDGVAQAERPPLAPDRRPGLAPRDPQVPAADGDRRLAHARKRRRTVGDAIRRLLHSERGSRHRRLRRDAPRDDRA